MSINPSAIETPTMVIDVSVAKQNIKRMQEQITQAACTLRPHIKTHKIPRFALEQLAAGAVGITCAKVSEAEVMAAGGVKDIFIAYPMVGTFRIDRAAALLSSLDRLILAVDSVEGAVALNNRAEELGVRFEVRLEIDTYAGRTGVSIGKVLGVAKTIHALKNLSLTGIFTFKSLVYQGKPTTDVALAAEEEGQLMNFVAVLLRDSGIPIMDVSAGSSPTAVAVAQTGLVTEVRPETYIFNDYMLYKKGMCSLDQLAAKVYATVVSANHSDYAIIDGGSKTFSTDVPLGSYYPGYAVVEGNENLILQRMNEEHGIIVAEDGKTNVAVGEVLTLLPIHVCTSMNMHNHVYLLEEDGSLTKQKVEARGCLV